MKPAVWIAFAALLASAARAQSPIFGLDLLNGELFRSKHTDFVNEYDVIGPNAATIRALDFDAAVATLWGIDTTTCEFGTLDLATGACTALGTIPGTDDVSGLTAAIDRKRRASARESCVAAWL